MTTPAGIETFGNQPAATVTSGGTTTGSTSFSITSTGADWPSASTSVTPNTFFRVTDQADTSEIMIVTTAAGGTGTDTWTVTRGAEGTSAIAHSANWTAVQVVTAGTLQNIKQTPSASVTAVTVNTTSETVLATYTPQAVDLTAGATWEAIAFGSIEKLGSTGTFTFRLRWGGVAGTLLTSHVTGTGSLNITTLASGSSFDVNGTVTLLSPTSAVANLNYFASAASGTVSAQGCASNGSGVTISGGGPLVLTAQLSTTANSNSLTVPAPLIYRAA